MSGTEEPRVVNCIGGKAGKFEVGLGGTTKNALCDMYAESCRMYLDV